MILKRAHIASGVPSLAAGEVCLASTTSQWDKHPFIKDQFAASRDEPAYVRESRGERMRV